jgi:DNA-binding MarR family transcriptional regulator
MGDSSATDDARQFGELFPAVYLRFHRRDGKQRQLLAQTGPLTVGEMAKHLDRAQSVVSEIVDHLQADGLLERMTDPSDKRRTLVWLSDQGLALLEQEREVLSSELLARAMDRMQPRARRALLSGMRALLAADQEPPKRKPKS